MVRCRYSVSSFAFERNRKKERQMSGTTLASGGSSSGKRCPYLRVCVAVVFFLVFRSEATSAWGKLPQPGAGLTVRVEPAVTDVGVGQLITVNVTAEGAANLGAFQFDLIYDPAVVTVVGVELGPFLGSTGRTAQAVGPTIDNGVGMVSFAAFSFGNEPGPTGTGALAAITFRTVGSGTSGLSLQNVLVTDTMAETQSVSVEGGTVTVGAPASTPAPTMTPMPSSRPTATPTAVPRLTRTPTATRTARPVTTAAPTGAAAATATDEATTSPTAPPAVVTATATRMATAAPTSGGLSTSTPVATPQPQADGTGMPAPTPDVASSPSTPRPPESAAVTATAATALSTSPTPARSLPGALSSPVCWLPAGAVFLLGAVVAGYVLFVLMRRHRG